ncbi:MAG TPA: hypothetical protein VF141_08690 [Chryseolinea sp.]
MLTNYDLAEQKEELATQSEELIDANRVIHELNMDLEKKVHIRTAELRKAYEELDTFFYRSSHDFRRPLTTFIGLAEVAKISFSDKQVLDLFEKVKNTAINLDHMLTKLQAISYIRDNTYTGNRISISDILERSKID